MLVYTTIQDETAPEAVVLPSHDATVAELLDRVGASRSAQGRELDLADPSPSGVATSTTLRELGVREGDLLTIRATGSARPPVAQADAATVDVAALTAAAPSGKKRISEYEEVTQLLQWHAPFHINSDRPSHQVWSDDSTVLRCGDWAAYRSPDKLYYRTYTTKQSRAERAVSTAFSFAEESGQLRDVDGAHVERMRGLVPALQYPDWGLCMVHQHTTRFALSSWIAGATEFMMFDELRHAQLYGRLSLAYGEHHDGFDAPRELWMSADHLQPARRVVEELLAELDWAKAVVVAGLFVEPLLTSVAHAVLSTRSLRSGDSLTPFVCQSIAQDKTRHRESAAALVELVVADPAHGAVNRDHIAGWGAEWLPRALASALALADGDPVARTAVDAALDQIETQLTTSGMNEGITRAALEMS